MKGDDMFDTKSTTQYGVVMNITPGDAQKLLDTSVGNRTIQQWRVDLLSAAMKRGEWMVTNQGIGFDVNGALRDGHHRLRACVQSGVTFRTMVFFGMDTDSYQVIDTGKVRKVADRLGIPKNVSEVLYLGCTYALQSSQPTAAQMLPFLDSTFGKTAFRLLDTHSSGVRFYSCAAMRLAAVIRCISDNHEDYVFDQYGALITMNIAKMAAVSGSLVRQVQSGKARASDRPDTLARGLIVFDYHRRNLNRISVDVGDQSAGIEFVRDVMNKQVGCLL